MNDSNIGCEQHIGIWVGGVSFTICLVSMLDSIYIKYDSKILFAWYPDTSIHIQIEDTTVVSSLNNIYYYPLYHTTILLT